MSFPVRSITLGSAALLFQDKALEGFAIKNPWAGMLWVALGFGLIITVLTWEPVVRRRYTLHLSSVHGGSKTLRLEPPELGGTKKLRKITLALVADMREFECSELPTAADRFGQDQLHIAEMNNAATEDEKHAIWNQQIQRRMQSEEEHGQKLRDRFGGRMNYAIREFRRRGMISESEQSKLEWETGTGSPWWFAHAANTLEGLAQQL